MSDIRWATNPKIAHEMARFFIDNLQESYISHSELQSERAIAVGRWASNLPDVLKAEIEERISAEGGVIWPDRQATPILEARIAGGALVGAAMVTFTPKSAARQAPVPFIVIEDLIVDRSIRGTGIGQAMLKFIVATAQANGYRRVFLESGLENHDAHEFFQKAQFRQVSHVFMCDLPV